MVKFLFLNGPVYLSFWSYNPYSLKIVIPTASFLFWVLYFFKREIVIKGSEVDYDVPTSTLKIKDKEKNYKSTLVEVFSGTIWEAELVKSMIEDAKIQTYIKNEIMGTLNPWWVAPGGAGSVTVVVSSLDYEEAKKVVIDYEKNISQE